MADNSLEGVVERLSATMSSIMPTDAEPSEVAIFEEFLAELTDDDDAPPSGASRDAKYYLSIQKAKMRSLGLNVKETIKPSGALDKIVGSVFDGANYIARRLFKQYDRKSVYTLNGKKIYTYKDRLTLYQTLIYAKKSVPRDASFICPSCGGFSTLSELEDGCKFCGKHFIMSELFPKVVGHHWLRAYSIGKGDMPKRVLRSTLVGTGIGILVAIIMLLTGSWDKFVQENDYEGLPPFLYLGFTGAIVGLFVSPLTLLARPLHDLFSSAGLLPRVMGTRRIIADAMKPIDPYFFFEMFESRVVSLFKIMLFADDLSENAAYCGKEPPPPSDVIEAVYRGALEIKRVETIDDFTYVTLTVFADCLHFRNGKIKRSNDEYEMVVVRNSALTTDPAFSLTKVECSSCGGSFDAARAKKCPYCSTDYRLFDHDWAVYSIAFRGKR